MASSEALSYAYLEAHPADAARVLERLAPASAAALLQSAPLRLACPVLRQMLPLAGARCLERLDDADTAGLLRGVGAQAGVALLRYVGAERRVRLLAQLPTALTLAYELLLGYPEGTVGASMDPRALALPADMTAGESLARVRSADETFASDPHVIDRDQRLLGYVDLAELLRAPAATSLARLVRPSPHRLPAQALLAGCREHPGWRDASALPVVERGDRLVGALTHGALLRALSTQQRTPAPRRTEDTLAGVAGAYWFGVSSMIEAVVGLLPVERREGDT
ncbi:MAG: magnesium transporter [Sterolibacteriaceae bacterium]|uniref:Magnesium transporter n=1 Tax=Candidatus Methylophosphatis roskildensis TaxID=2899263 RepID=A0A9D7E614_9PROT|nr:magnesium transporter [Candidatus Methylophosphatis roskildensis]MBK6974804.1 magnesium transporter [Candidatus Methylophosphatis roskildensis]MBK7235983.1 magnesium transporter [Sterolibacteriaceae bacterium]